MGFFKQLGTILWKNWILQKRRVCVSIFELALPLFFAALLLLLRAVIEPDPQDTNTVYAKQNVTLNSLYFSHSNVSIIGYSPNSTEVAKVMASVEQLFNHYTPGVSPNFMAFADEDSMVNYFKENSDVMRHCIAFDITDTVGAPLPQNIEFAVRPYTGNDRWRTRLTYQPVQTNTPRDNDNNLYRERGVLYFQRLVGEALTKYWLTETGGNPNDVSVDVLSQRMAYPPYVEDSMILVMQGNLPLFLVLSFILSIIVNTKNLVYEKEKKLKESMKLMGMKSSVHFASWFITFSVYLIPSLLIYSILIGANIIKDKGPILAESDVSLVFVFLLLYGFSMITFCFMVGSFVQKANVGAAVSGVLFFATYCPYVYLNNNYEDLDRSTKLGTCLLFNCAVGLGSKVIGLYEGTGAGAQWSNFADPASVDDNLSLLECMVMLVVDGLWHLLVFWYIDNVRPGEFGVPKPFYFCFTKSYWCGGSKANKKGNTSYQTEDENNQRFEKEPTNLNRGIQIDKLRKMYGQKTAVQDISLNMYEGQIFVLLGHNGAGKTTTMSMLTGFTPPSGGTAIVNDCDITDNIEGVRSSLGLCPQHNILFDSLTVREHLYFFAELKGASCKQAEAEILPLLKEVDLEKKIDDRSENLSGGQKRKLSVAIALIANSKVVILDEPSSGMDPAARRQTWNALQNNRAGRTIVLTTHYMDEADVLGDRIAIMAEGVVKCCGSSMFLKKLYGAGYHLVVVKEDNCDIDQLTNVITSHIENAKLESIINLEITYLLPDKETAKFPELFTILEMSKSKLGISSFGTSATTMEEVFLRVGDSAEHHDDENEVMENGKNGFVNPGYDKEKLTGSDSCFGKNKVHSSSDDAEVTEKTIDIMGREVDEPSSHMSTISTVSKFVGEEKEESVVNSRINPGRVFNKGYTKRTGLRLDMGRMYALFVKKALHTWRNRVITLVQLLLPVLFTIAGLALDELRPDTLEDPALTLDLSSFGRTSIPTTAGLTPTADDSQFETVYGQQFGSGQNIQSFLLSQHSTYDNYTLDKAETVGISTFNKRYIIGLEMEDSSPSIQLQAISHYNGQPFHAEGIAINYLMNALLQNYLNSSYSLQSSIHPLPKDLKSSAENDALLAQSGGFTVGLFISFGMAFLTTLFIHYLIKERQVGSKHLQVVSGVNPFSYWIPTFLWDFVNYIIPSLLLLIVFLAYSKTAYVGDERWLIVILVLAMYGWAVLPYMYTLQFAFKEPPTGVVTVIMLNIFSGLVCLLAVFVLQIPDLNLTDIADILDIVFMILFPNYGMAQAFVYLYTNYSFNNLCKDVPCNGEKSPCCSNTCGGVGFCYDYEENYFSMSSPGIGKYMVCFALQGAFFFIMVALIEYNVFQKIWYLIQGSSKGPDLHSYENNASNAEDSDVASERQRINSSPASVLSAKDSLLLVNLYKRYGNFVAVDHICVGIPEQECFGLLGQNGAGKTTTFKMLTGDVMVTGGNAYLTGYDVRNDIKNVQSNMGYCPQFDALIDQMTGRETLTMYARLRGVPEANIREVVNHLIDILMLRPHADKLSGAYSGGNKRKLSTAIALVGDPQFIMLDEPSAGMDPKARRQLWNVLSQVRASGRTLILTSHSMEECDALCTRLAIMVNGRFVCLGSPQHIKNKFGHGYTLIVQLGSLQDGTTAPIEPVVNFVLENFPGAKVFDDHQGYAHFQVPDSEVKLATVFSLMESTKLHLNVRDYSVHQTTLEQVFLTFTRSQVMPKEEKKKSALTEILCCCCIQCGCMK